MARRSQAGTVAIGPAAVVPGRMPWWRPEDLERRIIVGTMIHRGAYDNTNGSNPPRLSLSFYVR
ncbi:hypothetical protein [Mesorhizobium australicum]|uniref:hypothetical protein n=1 Tax=Mesorhizobium australicum TaxID=536018 RepID=UPI003EBF6117